MGQYKIVYSVDSTTYEEIREGTSALEIMAQVYKKIGKPVDGFSVTKIKD